MHGKPGEAAAILKLSWREALDIPDGRVENTYENRLKIVRVLRELRPRVVILPYWQGRHPDHYTASTLGYEACFLSGLSKLQDQANPPHRPFKILYASLYADVRPSFVVDITEFAEQRLQSLLAYRSQYAAQSGAARCSSRRMRSASAPWPRRATTERSPECAMQNPLCRRKWGWWAT